MAGWFACFVHPALLGEDLDNGVLYTGTRTYQQVKMTWCIDMPARVAVSVQRYIFTCCACCGGQDSGQGLPWWPLPVLLLLGTAALHQHMPISGFCMVYANKYNCMVHFASASDCVRQWMQHMGDGLIFTRVTGIPCRGSSLLHAVLGARSLQHAL